MESEMLPDEAEPALEADEATLSAWAGKDMAAAANARASARVRFVKVMVSFSSILGITMVQGPRSAGKAHVVLPQTT